MPYDGVWLGLLYTELRHGPLLISTLALFAQWGHRSCCHNMLLPKVVLVLLPWPRLLLQSTRINFLFAGKTEASLAVERLENKVNHQSLPAGQNSISGIDLNSLPGTLLIRCMSRRQIYEKRTLHIYIMSHWKANRYLNGIFDDLWDPNMTSMSVVSEMCSLLSPVFREVKNA